MKVKFKDGWECKQCQTRHDFEKWVKSEWENIIFQNCSNCGARHKVQKGRIKLVRKGRKKKCG